MKKLIHQATFLLLSVLFLASCSMVKNIESNNFQKNKYRAHLNKSNKIKNQEVSAAKPVKLNKTAITIESNTNSENELVSIASSNKKSEIESKPVKFEAPKVIKPKASELQAGNLVLSPQLQFEDFSSTTFVSKDWWENDPSDWPWKDIVLAVLLILIILLVIVLLIDILGAVFGSLLGLIVLLLLIYILLVHFG